MVDLRKTHAFEPGKNREIPDEVFAEIGCRLILLQDLEMFIAFTAKVVFSKDAQKAIDAILNAENKTLGQLLNLLRKKVNVDETFDERLKRTLKARNLFVHEFSHEYDLRTKAGLQQGIKFLLNTMDDLEEVTKVMKALIGSFGEDREMGDSEIEQYWRKHGDLDELESKYMPKLSEIFTKKSL